MKYTSTTQETGSVLVILAIIVAVAFAGFYFWRKATAPNPIVSTTAAPETTIPSYIPSNPTPQPITSDSDLMQVSGQLDTTAIDVPINTVLSQNDQDVRTFTSK